VIRAYALQKLREYGELEATTRRLTDSLISLVSSAPAVETLADHRSTRSARGKRPPENGHNASRGRAEEALVETTGSVPVKVMPAIAARSLENECRPGEPLLFGNARCSAKT